MLNIILFFETEIYPETRIFMQYNSHKECMDGICGFYEMYLMILNPTASIITYEIDQLFEFLDNLVPCCVYQPDTMIYVQFDIHRKKLKLFIHLSILNFLNSS